jgi:hypothetical protein
MVWKVENQTNEARRENSNTKTGKETKMPMIKPPAEPPTANTKILNNGLGTLARDFIRKPTVTM